MWWIWLLFAWALASFIVAIGLSRWFRILRGDFD